MENTIFYLELSHPYSPLTQITIPIPYNEILILI